MSYADYVAAIARLIGDVDQDVVRLLPDMIACAEQRIYRDFEVLRLATRG